MAIDRRHVGYALPPFTVTVEPERLAAFARAIGERDPRYAERVAPLTFMKVLEGEHGSSRKILEVLGVPLPRVLHAEQQFDYLAPILAGQVVTVSRRVVDLYEKKGGAMEFIVIESVFTGGEAEVLGRSRQVVAVRNPPPEARS
jgi:hypothetical protein